jgi:hypothetical protein
MPGTPPGGAIQGPHEGGREEGEGKRGDLTSRLDDRRQPLTGIPPRARGGGERWKRGRGKLLRGKREMGERVARAWGGWCNTPSVTRTKTCA